jgi:hypothetical protein
MECFNSKIDLGTAKRRSARIDLQDLRRRLYVKAKAETSWRFWSLYGKAQEMFGRCVQVSTSITADARNGGRSGEGGGTRH